MLWQKAVIKQCSLQSKHTFPECGSCLGWNCNVFPWSGPSHLLKKPHFFFLFINAVCTESVSELQPLLERADTYIKKDTILSKALCLYLNSCLNQYLALISKKLFNSPPQLLSHYLKSRNASDLKHSAQWYTRGWLKSITWMFLLL